ncbi:glutaredoxin family protein [Alkalicoccus daliensis]|uniref:Glutaredoxin-like domain n=1 Tax=Alkalicoccus daliensis TaxID=745820 RepID=A0A1H0JB42_9BACI|nr:glutaredoxin family protein [Alkalicoccus daliensis]SDO40719.1 Glutaredoxin-like domain [Alkalicoccus daliensis]
MKLYFYTKENCPLCDKAWAKLEDLQREKNFEIEVRDIYTNDDWLEVYQIRIPVIETENGIVLDEGIVSYITLAEKFAEF